MPVLALQSVSVVLIQYHCYSMYRNDRDDGHRGHGDGHDRRTGAGE